MIGVKQPYRLRAIHRPMSFATFERTVPVRPGWKREYYDGKAHVRPSWTTVTFRLPLERRSFGRAEGVRPLTESDADALLDAFLDSFRYAPEYADNPMPAYRQKAAQYIDGFYGTVRGRRSPASAVVVRGGVVAAAALAKERDGREPLLDCVFVRPAFFRNGLATAVTTVVANRLFDAGYRELTSHAMLANETSLAWHHQFGFRELPDLWVAQARCFSAKHEVERLGTLGVLTDKERARLWAIAERWWEEVRRLEQLPSDEHYPRRDG